MSVVEPNALDAVNVRTRHSLWRVDPAAVLTAQLAEARRSGVTFEDAWGPAFKAALAAAANGWERREWSVVLADMVGTWRSAFECRPAPSREIALRRIAEDPDRVPLPERECARCGREISDARGRRGGPARYCSDACRRLVSEERRAVAA
jgi:hypothetical protein